MAWSHRHLIATSAAGRPFLVEIPLREDVVKQLHRGFARDVIKLSFGTLVGRLIAVAALPIVTQVYSPADFALLAVFLGVVSPLAVVACLRLEVAIPMAVTNSEAAETLVLALLALAAVSGGVAIIALTIPEKISAWVGAPALAPYLWLVPLGVLLTGSYSALQFWATRARRVGAIARTRVGQAVAGVLTMLALGWSGIAPLGLLLGNMLNMGAGGISLAFNAVTRDGSTLRSVRFPDLCRTLRRNYRYPVYSTPEALLNVAGVQVPVLLIAAHAGPEAGFLLLAMQIMIAPMTLLGTSVSQVYVSRAPEEHRAGRLAPFTLSIMRRLVLMGVGPLVLAGATAPLVFPLLFGARWGRAGEIVTWLTPWMALQFFASPVSMVMYVVGRQKAMLALTTIGFLLRVGGVLLATQVFDVSAIGGFIAGSVAYYAAVAGFVIAAAGLANRQGFPLLAAFLDWRVVAPTAVGAAIVCAS
jgi:O-antigen/teichoic acid export membrane protein